MRYIDLFAGIGGFALALNRQGHTCVYSNEWDKYAAQTYEKNFCKRRTTEERSDNGGNKPSSNSSNGGGRRSCSNCNAEEHEIDTRDITTVSTSQIPDHDLLVGGFPCQAFSIAGKRGGFTDTRGTLFFDIARILKDKRPRHFILENVKGLLSHDGGKTLQTIFRVLTDLGYEYQWQVLNSKDFGVPQNRERIFIVGHIRGERRPKVFPLTTSTETLSNVPIYDRKGFDSRTKGFRKGKVSPTLSTKMGTGGNNVPMVQRAPLKFMNRNQKNIEGDYAYTVDGAQTGGVAIDLTRRAKDNHRIRKDNRAGTLDANYYKGLANQERPGVLENMRIRRLTPTECERLQGFPDGWTEGVSDTQRYKQLGNAVTVNVVEAVVRRLYD